MAPMLASSRAANRRFVASSSTTSTWRRWGSVIHAVMYGVNGDLDDRPSQLSADNILLAVDRSRCGGLIGLCDEARSVSSPPFIGDAAPRLGETLPRAECRWKSDCSCAPTSAVLPNDIVAAAARGEGSDCRRSYMRLLSTCCCRLDDDAFADALEVLCAWGTFPSAAAVLHAAAIVGLVGMKISSASNPCAPFPSTCCCC